MTEVTVKTERIDDIPLLLHIQSKMGIGVVISEVIKAHGNRGGLCIGALVMVWLSYILSEGDHRMSELEEWASGQIEMLRALMPECVVEKDFTDDRLADILRMLSDDKLWEEVEINLGRRLIRVYNLGGGVVRLDSTAVAVYHDEDETTLFRKGWTKDHRPDLAQFKVMLGTLDPLGMPLATLVVCGNEADDGLYLPAISRAQKVLGTGGQLYVGDSKMGALQIRAHIASTKDYYLMPLPQTGNNPKLLKEMVQAVKEKKQQVEIIHAPVKEGSKPEVAALGYEMLRQQVGEIEGKTIQWDERVMAIFSPSLALQQRRGLHKRLNSAEQAVKELTPEKGKKQWESDGQLEAAAKSILKKYKVEGLLELNFEQTVESIHKRKYKERPEHTEQMIDFRVTVVRNLAAISNAHQLMGWRLYASNCPKFKLPFQQAVEAYHASPRIEHNFSRLKGKPLGLRPLYVQREDHTKGMVRLLSLALRVLTVTEFVVRQALSIANITLGGLYSGNPKRQSARPTTERLLKAFRGITLTLICFPNQIIIHISPLSELQKQILILLGLTASIYEDIAGEVQPIPP